MINPKLPKELDNVVIKRQFRDTLYEIHISHHPDKGIFKDGVKLKSNIVKNDKLKLLIKVNV